jgi:hypothetical protein
MSPCLSFVTLLFLSCCAIPATAQPVLPIVENANWEKFQEHGGRLFEAMRDLKVDVPPLAEREFKGLATAADREEALKIIQKHLDAQCLLGININPESRVKVARGAAGPLLVKDRDVYFLIKVQNEGGVTSTVAVSGPQLVVKNEPAEGRWLHATILHVAQQERGLGGHRLEYVLLRLRATESGKREATLRFDVGQGTQDLGFRAEVPILFVVK